MVYFRYNWAKTCQAFPKADTLLSPPPLVIPPESWQYSLQEGAEVREEGKDAPCSAVAEAQHWSYLPDYDQAPLFLCVASQSPQIPVDEPLSIDSTVNMIRQTPLLCYFVQKKGFGGCN